MARAVGPDEGCRLVFRTAGSALESAAGLVATVYNPDQTTLADILTYPGGVSIAGSQVTVGSDSELPLIQFPDGVTKLYVSVNGGPLTAIYARAQDQIDALSSVSFRGSWAASTGYAVGDLVNIGGELLSCATAHTSAGSFSLTNWNVLTAKPSTYNAKLYGAKGDGKVFIDGTTTNGSPTLVCASGPFTSADVGKLIVIDGAGAAGAPLSTTIAGYTSATTVTLGANASVTITGVAPTIGLFGTDDTTAIKALLTAATTGATADGTRHAELLFPAGTYVVGGALVQGGSTKGNAQIPIPVNATTNAKITYVFKGVSDGAALPHWQQTTPQRAGSVIASTLTGAAYSGTYGLPSIIGGPTQEQGYATTGALFNNVCVVVDGITLMAPANPTVCGWDFRGTAECNVRNGAAQALQTVPTAAVSNTFMTALLMPLNGNNDYAEIGEWSCEGWYCGVAISEHTHARSIRSILCARGLRVLGPYPHASLVEYYSVEACPIYVEYVDSTNGGQFPVAFSAPGSYVVIAMMDTEDGTGGFAKNYDISDTGNALFGEINVAPNAHTGQIGVAGGSDLRVIDLSQNTGVPTAPGVPSSTVALHNPFWRDATVYVTGGTVSAVKVNATTIATATGAVAAVPANGNISLTYTVAPSWTWVLF